MSSRLYIVCVFNALLTVTAADHAVWTAVGSSVEIPCEANDDVSIFFYRSWSRGYQDAVIHNATKIFHQISGSTPERLTDGRPDIEVSIPAFNLTINEVTQQDDTVFTCYVYRKQKTTHSYVTVNVKPEDGRVQANNTPSIVGISVGTVLTLGVLSAAVLICRKKTSGDSLREHVRTESTDSLHSASTSSEMLFYNKED